MEKLFHMIGLDPTVYLPYLLQQLTEPYNIILALFVIMIRAGFKGERNWLFFRLVLMLVLFYQFFTLKLQLGFIPDVGIANMLKLMVPVVLFWWGAGALGHTLISPNHTGRRLKDWHFYLLLCCVCLIAVFLLAMIKGGLPFGELARFIPEIILASHNAKILLCVPVILGVVIYVFGDKTR